MGISVFEHRQPDALPVPLYATLPLDQVTFDQATLALIVQRRLPLFLHTITPETLDDIARATGVRGHIVLLLPETGDRQHILHLWGSSVAAEEQEQLETIALHLASLLAHIIEREQSTHRRRRLDALSDAARTIVSLRSVDDVLYEICRQATILLSAEQSSIYLPTDDPTMLVCAMTAGAAEHLKGEPIPLSAAWWGGPSAKAFPWHLPTSKPSRTCTVRSGKPIGCALRCFSHCTIEGASSACSASCDACPHPSMMMTG
jgi:hypothetical protein